MSLDVPDAARALGASPPAAEAADPFFVVGTDRSGTTLLRLMLNEHPRLHVPPESGFVSGLMDALPVGAPLSPAQLRLAGEIVAGHWRWKDWEVSEEVLKEALADASGGDLAAVVDRVFRIGTRQRGKQRWGDKTPIYVEEIDRLHRLFPRAKFLHLIRDGRDVGLSLRALGWRGRTVLDVARYWSRSVEAALAAGRPLGPGLYCELRYEDLVLDTEETLRRACAFLGEAFDGRMLRFHESAPREIAAWERPIHAKLVRPPAPSDVGRWRREMSRTAVALFEAVAGPTLEAAGYAPHFRRSAPLQRGAVRAAVAAAGGLRRAGLMPDWRGIAGRRRGARGGAEDSRAGRPFMWRWEVGAARADLDRHASAWNALAHSRSSSLFSDAAWIRAFADAFLPRERIFLHVLAGGGRAAAVLPLRKAGRLLPSWSVLANHHTPGPPFAVDEGAPEVYGRILDHLLGSARVADFGALPSGGAPCRRLIAAARERRLLCALKGASAEAVVDLGGGWARLRGALPPSLRKNAEAGERKLTALGALAFDVVERPRDLHRVLEECFHLETLGWKGRTGTPIRSSPAALRFYTDLAHAAAAQSRLALYTLRLGPRLVAFEYCLRAQGRIALLKISYDPEFARHSPGHVLRCRILQRESERGEIAVYSMGPESPWKVRWATRIEPMARLRVYGPGLVSTAAFAAGPGLRTLLGRSALLRALARRRREAREARRRDRKGR